MNHSGKFVLQWRKDGEFLAYLELTPGTDTACWTKEKISAIRMSWGHAKAIRDLWSKSMVKIVRA